jgi:hypothetical protein
MASNSRKILGTNRRCPFFTSDKVDHGDAIHLKHCCIPSECIGAQVQFPPAQFCDGSRKRSKFSQFSELFILEGKLAALAFTFFGIKTHLLIPLNPKMDDRPEENAAYAEHAGIHEELPTPKSAALVERNTASAVKRISPLESRLPHGVRRRVSKTSPIGPAEIEKSNKAISRVVPKMETGSSVKFISWR